MDYIPQITFASSQLIEEMADGIGFISLHFLIPPTTARVLNTTPAKSYLLPSCQLTAKEINTHLYPHLGTSQAGPLIPSNSADEPCGVYSLSGEHEENSVPGSNLHRFPTKSSISPISLHCCRCLAYCLGAC